MRLRDRFLVLSVLVVAGALASAARAGNGDFLWNDVEAADGGSHATASDGNGGVIVATDRGGIYVQRLDSSGAPLWTSGGVALSPTGDSPAIYADPFWGATVAWVESDGIYVQRVNPSGAPQWAAGGVKVASGTVWVPLVVHVPGPGFPPPAPGAFVAFVAPSLYARLAHVDGNGSVTAPGVDGISLGGQVRCALGCYIRMVSDQAGGAIVAWADVFYNIVAQRVNKGLPWGSTPTVVSNDVRNEGPLDAAPDGSGGALISWSALLLSPANAQIRAQRIAANGNPLWTANGVVVVDSAVVGGDQTWWTTFALESAVTSDGAGGAIVAWNDWRNADTANPGNDDLYAQRVNSSGAKAWTLSDGILLPPYIVGQTAPGSQRAPRIVADGIGGAVVTYMDLGGNSWDISATRLGASGSQHWSRYVFTDFGDPTEYEQRWPELVFDGSGPAPPGVVIAWDDAGSSVDIHAEKIDLSSPSNDTPAGAIPIGPFQGKWGTLALATPTELPSCVSASTPDLWYRFDSPSTGTLRVDTCGTHDGGGLRVDQGMDTVLSLYSLDTSTQYACNDDWPSSADPARCGEDDTGTRLDSYVERALSPGESVLIRVSRYTTSVDGPFVLFVEYEFEGNECSDGIDNDGDGGVDFGGDPGCDSAADPWEGSAALPCDDFVDNDGDGRKDFDLTTYFDPGDETTPPAGQGDPGCGSPKALREDPQCQDGLHNDVDGKMDYDAGLSANGSADSAGPDPDCVGKPWKNKERKGCGLGYELAFLLPALMWMRARHRRVGV